MDHWNKQCPSASQTLNPTWVEYQVVRLWEDILEMLPSILEPLPIKLSSILEKSDSDTKKWENRLTYKLKSEDEILDATAWISRRHLDTGYLNPGASIRIWSTKDEVLIRWDNRGRVIDGISVWSAQYGIYRMSVDAFVQEVHSFHEQLMNVMEERVATVIANKGINLMQIDLKQLANEHEDRKKWLGSALSQSRLSPRPEEVLSLLAENNIDNN